MNPYKHLQSILEHPWSSQHNYFGSITSWLRDIIECSRKFHGMHASMTKHSRNFLIIILNAIPAEFKDCKSTCKIPRYWWNWHTRYTCENLERTHRWLKLYDVLRYLPAVSSEELLRRGMPIIGWGETATWKKQDSLWNRKWMQHLREVIQVLSCSS